jgi:hypothetical protein
MRFAFTEPGRGVPWWSRPFGVGPRSCAVVVDDERLTATFGSWTVSTPIENVAGAEITGPYRWWRVAGPARYGLGDGSLTFATRDDRGVEISFLEPVAGIDPWGRARHPTLTVTVADADGLVEELRTRSLGGGNR